MVDTSFAPALIARPVAHDALIILIWVDHTVMAGKNSHIVVRIREMN